MLEKKPLWCSLKGVHKQVMKGVRIYYELTTNISQLQLLFLPPSQSFHLVEMDPKCFYSKTQRSQRIN